MNPLQDRLRTFVGTLGISVQEFERQCCIKAGTASRMTEKSYSTTFHKIHTTYPQLNMDWLKTGQGEMLNSCPNQSIVNSGKVGGDINQAGHDLSITEPCQEDKVVIDALTKEIEYLTALIAEKDKRIESLEHSLARKDAQLDRLIDLIEKK